MVSIPIVSDLLDALTSLPAALAEIPAKQTEARERLLDSVTTLGEAVSQALNVVSVRCGSMVLKKDDLNAFRQEMVNAPILLNEFRLRGVCAGLGKVRAELRTLLSMQTLSVQVFHKKQLEGLLAQIQDKERDLEEDFDRFLRDLSRRGSTLEPKEIPDIVQYVRDCQTRFESDVTVIRQALRKVEHSH
jgi:hypothetical protein